MTQREILVRQLRRPLRVARETRMAMAEQRRKLEETYS